MEEKVCVECKEIINDLPGRSAQEICSDCEVINALGNYCGEYP